jgi:TolB-like protein/Flp pilus assembly protein TadD
MAHIVGFESFEVDLAAGQLRKRGLRIGLRDKSFQVLASLLERPGEVVTREELRQRLWSDEVFVDFDNNLNTAVARLRQALGDSAEHPRFIETLPKRGYRFLAKVSEPAHAVGAARGRRHKLVVLPFVNLSGDPAQEYFSDAMTDELITELASLGRGELAVIARTTAMRYKGSHKDVAQIGRELAVDYVLEGAVRRAGDSVAINLQLIRTGDQTHVFAKKYSAAWRDLFALQSRAAREIAGCIDPAPGGVAAGTAPARKPAVDLAAYNEYIQGRFHFGWGTPEALAIAKEHLERAIARDPGFAPPFDTLAEVYWYMGYFGYVRPREAFSAGIAHALRALEIDNRRAETHALLGEYHKTVGYNWPEVQREMDLALGLDPNSPVVRTRYALSGLMPHGRVEDAAAELERALEVDPLAPDTRAWLGLMWVLARRFERGIAEGQKLLELNPTHFVGHLVMARCFSYGKKFEEAIAAQRKAVEFTGGSVMMLGWLGLALAEAGHLARAREVLRQLHGLAAKGYVPPTSFVWVHIGLGEMGAAFEWMDRAVEECDQMMMPIKTYAFLDPYRSDPRYVALLRKMKLEP